VPFVARVNTRFALVSMRNPGSRTPHRPQPRRWPRWTEAELETVGKSAVLTAPSRRKALAQLAERFQGGLTVSSISVLSGVRSAGNWARR